MIPVEVPADTQPHVVRSGITIAPASYLADHPCPVCDEPLSDRPCSLVYIGTHPYVRSCDGMRWTGAAVAVHDTCAETDGDTIRHGETIRQPACDPDHLIEDLGDLSLALGGDRTSFTAELLRLTAKADSGNRRRLTVAFPRTVRAFELWEAAGPMPAGELLAVLDAMTEGKVPA